jgi:Domain of unknown function (DUF4294)
LQGLFFGMLIVFLHRMRLLILLTVLFASQNINAQEVLTTYKVINGDTVPVKKLEPVTAFANLKFDNDTLLYNYNQMKYYMESVYPFAVKAVALFNELDAETINMSGGEKRKYVRSREKEIKAQFEDKLKKLNKTQGKYLVKMINRNAKRSCFDIVNYLHNPFKANAWQAWSKLNGIDLNENYNPEENKRFERIMRIIESRG